jgi:hypothetical protein
MVSAAAEVNVRLAPNWITPEAATNDIDALLVVVKSLLTAIPFACVLVRLKSPPVAVHAPVSVISPLAVCVTAPVAVHNDVTSTVPAASSVSAADATVCAVTAKLRPTFTVRDPASVSVPPDDVCMVSVKSLVAPVVVTSLFNVMPKLVLDIASVSVAVHAPVTATRLADPSPNPPDAMVAQLMVV